MDGNCFRCGIPGHFAHNCTEKGGKGGGKGFSSGGMLAPAFLARPGPAELGGPGPTFPSGPCGQNPIHHAPPMQGWQYMAEADLQCQPAIALIRHFPTPMVRFMTLFNFCVVGMTAISLLNQPLGAITPFFQSWEVPRNRDKDLLTQRMVKAVMHCFNGKMIPGVARGCPMRQSHTLPMDRVYGQHGREPSPLRASIQRRPIS